MKKYPTTNIYRKDTLVRREKAMTFSEYINFGRLEPGQYIIIGVIKYQGDWACQADTEGIWVGDCTPYHQPSDNDRDGGIKWNYDAPNMQKIVLEVHTYK